MSLSLNSYAGVAKSMMDEAGHSAADITVQTYKKGIKFIRAEDLSPTGAFARGAVVGASIVLTATAATLYISMVASAASTAKAASAATTASAILSPRVASATFSALMSLSKYINAQMSAKGDKAKALSDAQQDQTGFSVSRVAALLTPEVISTTFSTLVSLSKYIPVQAWYNSDAQQAKTGFYAGWITAAASAPLSPEVISTTFSTLVSLSKYIPAQAWYNNDDAIARSYDHQDKNDASTTSVELDEYVLVNID